MLCRRISSWDDLRIEAARSRQKWDGEVGHEYRLTIVVEKDRKSLAQLLAAARSLLEKNSGKQSWSTPDGIYYGGGVGSPGAPPEGGTATAGKLAMVFPGQGSQYVGMLRDLTCRFPQMQKSLARGQRVVCREPLRTPRRLSDFIYPVPVFSDEARKQSDDALRATDVTQPALGALSLGSLRILNHFGVRPDAAAGHSFGELTALCAAGWIDAGFTAHSRRSTWPAYGRGQRRSRRHAGG